MCTREEEDQCLRTGSRCVVGVDEVGRGCLAGPVTVCACHIPLDVNIPGIKDSKQLSEKQRNALYSQLTSDPRVKYSVVSIPPERIDEINILHATLEGMKNSVENLQREVAVDTVLIDGNQIPKTFPRNLKVKAIVKGDCKCTCIGAASIIAKVTRDRLMTQYESQYPGYGFEQHKGYPTKQHKEALSHRGATPIHRRSFRGVE